MVADETDRADDFEVVGAATAAVGRIEDKDLVAGAATDDASDGGGKRGLSKKK